MNKYSYINIIVFPFILTVGTWISTGSTACASQYDQEIGTVNMQGSIIVPACAIETSDLSIDMTATTVGEMLQNGMGEPHHFSLNLVNCELGTSDSSPHFLTTFDGPAENGLFTLQGAHWGGLQIRDEAGNIAVPGKAMPADILAVEKPRLDYTLRLVWNHTQLVSGSYHAAIRFKVDYF